MRYIRQYKISCYRPLADIKSNTSQKLPILPFAVRTLPDEI
jgi:hypothetical protein